MTILKEPRPNSHSPELGGK